MTKRDLEQHRIAHEIAESMRAQPTATFDRRYAVVSRLLAEHGLAILELLDAAEAIWAEELKRS